MQCSLPTPLTAVNAHKRTGPRIATPLAKVVSQRNRRSLVALSTRMRVFRAAWPLPVNVLQATTATWIKLSAADEVFSSFVSTQCTMKMQCHKTEHVASSRRLTVLLQPAWWNQTPERFTEGNFIGEKNIGHACMAVTNMSTSQLWINQDIQFCNMIALWKKGQDGTNGSFHAILMQNLSTVIQKTKSICLLFSWYSR